MCITRILRTKHHRIKPVVRRIDEAMMPYAEIQFYSDCIRRYALSVGKPLDESVAFLERSGMLEQLRTMYQSVPRLTVTTAVRRIKKDLAKR